jgi:hypothetical protein
MLLTNRFNFFNKNGDNLNPQKRQATTVLIVDETQFPGIGAVINAYTNFEGQVVYIEIIDGGTGYDTSSYLEIRSIDNENLLFTIPSTDITFGVNGEIEAIALPASINNNDFPSPSLDYILDYSLERVSTGLIAVDQIYILENVYDSTGSTGTLSYGQSGYTYPRTENYGPFNINSYSANGTSGKVEIESFTFTGLVREYDSNTVSRVPAAVISSLAVGMNVTGSGVPADTFIYSINTARQTLVLTNPIPADSVGEISFTTYFPHDLRVGSKIFIDGGALDGGSYTLTQVDTFNLYFDTSLTVSSTSGAGVTYSVVPQFKAYVEGDESFFLFNVDYNVDYPTITKSKTIEFEFTQAASSDTIPTAVVGGTANNVLYQRTVYEDIQKTPFTLNIGHQADVEGVFLTVLRIIDNTFSSRPGLLFFGIYRAETEAEDERLGVLLSNIGRDVDAEQELILRDSEVDESNVDYILLNEKRKEMLLQGDQIWPYMGSYKGLVNMINWFGYYDIRLKEYFLNVNSMDTEFGKYRQVPITFQLKNKKESGQSINIVPSKHYRKTSLFGLFYDIVKDSGEFDENGTPLTTDAFTFTNEEALIKFFALKKYLREKFLPLNCQITDITGEGVYYERYTINSWKDVDERRVLELTRPIGFTCEERAPIEDLRSYSSQAYLSPTLEKTLQSFMNKYDILDITITNPGGPYTSIPQVSFPGTSNQQATGYAKVKGYTGSYTLSNPAGFGFTAGDIITLGGGSYSTPIRLLVTGVTGSGSVTDVQIQSGYSQGAGYASLPQAFSQMLVVSPVGSQYEVVNRTGFTASVSDLGYELDDVVFLNKGIGYSSYPQAVFSPNVGSTTADLDLKIYAGTPVGNINNGLRTERWNDSPNIPVGAVVSLSTEFPITWDEVPYSWNDVGGSTDANVIAHIDSLPGGNGEVVALEIVNPGTEYKFTPTLKIVSQEGSGATATASLRKGRLNLLEYTVTAVNSTGGGTNNEFTVTPDIAAAGTLNVSTNRLVTGSNIADIVLTSVITAGPGSTITVENYDSSPASTSVAIGDVILVHQGVAVTNGGSGYSNVPGVNVNSGHTRSIFTWSDLGRGEFYQMQWKVLLTEPVKSTAQFSYDSGIQPIDVLIDHTVVLPYIGKYTVEMIVYNTDNNFANLIKKNCVEVYMLESDFSYISKFVNDCIDSWDSLKQLPNTQENKTAQEIENTRYIEYKWDNATGRWVNLVFNNTDWEDMNFRWENLDVSDLSDVNNYNFPYCEDFSILEISPDDNLEGPVVDYLEPPTAVNPTIVVQGQRIYPQIEPPYNSANEWIFIRRDDTIYQLDVLDADYSNPGYTYIELVNDPPLAFKASPNTWEVLREIGGTVVLPGNKIYNEDSNPNGIQVGKFLKLFQKNSTPIRSRVPINGKNTYSGQPSSITLNGEGSDSSFTKKGEIGRIYKLRDQEINNGNLIWDPTTSASTWTIVAANTNDPEVRDHIGKIYIDQATATCNPLTEIRPGFTKIKLIAYVDGSLKYTQEFRTTHVYLDTSTVGAVYDIWNSSGVYVIDVVGIDGGPIDELDTYLVSLAASGNEEIYLEYEYLEFPTRIYYGEESGGNMTVYFDFNMYPSLGAFNNAQSTEFDSTAIADHTNWFFDNGIASGDFSMEVSQVGTWQGGVGTILTVSDTDSDLLRSSSSFVVCQRNFDEDSAERKLGTEIITWQNYQSTLWEESCGLSWNTVDYATPYWCNFIIDEVVQNSGLQFNEDDVYNFDGIVGGMSNAQIFTQALFELNNSTEGGLARFNYYPISESDISLIPAVINTYESSNSFTTNAPVAIGDVVYGNPFAPVSSVTGISGTTVTLDQDIVKKATFIGDCSAGGYTITNITGLLENQIIPGDVITSSTLPSYPSAGATVTNILVQQGKVREISLSSSCTANGDDITFYAEWETSSISTQILAGGTGTMFKIVAQAKTPSVDCLGYLTGEGGLTFETPDGNSSALSHSFPTGNYYSWLGFGPNKVGSFLNGLNDFVINYRNIQVYLEEGLSPFGYRGWYPAQELPLQYSYIGSSSFVNPVGGTGPIYTFDNRLEAPGESERLPYERSIGGALTWEETWAGDTNGRFPIGSSVILTSDTSKIAGKSKYLWRIKEGDDILVETTDSKIMWTFTYPGVFGVELTIEDTNGNTTVRQKDTFIEVNESTGS